VRHCSWLRWFLWLNQKSNRRADFLARQISGTRCSVQSHEGHDSVFWFTWLKNRLIWLDWTMDMDMDRTSSRKDPPSGWSPQAHPSWPRTTTKEHRTIVCSYHSCKFAMCPLGLWHQSLHGQLLSAKPTTLPWDCVMDWPNLLVFRASFQSDSCGKCELRW
jgi:hypothetical protein